MDNILFTSDNHFFHRGILHLGNGRPFSSVEEMNEIMIGRWNSCIGKSDRVYHLGDVSFGTVEQTIEVIKRLRGQKHFIRGNHDGILDSVLKKHPEFAQSYQKYKEITIDKQKLVLFHYPILSWHQMHRGSWMLHGHCHGNLHFDNGPMLDVGVDNFDFTPITFDAVKHYLEGVDIKHYDHHIPKEEDEVSSKSSK